MSSHPQGNVRSSRSLCLKLWQRHVKDEARSDEHKLVDEVGDGMLRFNKVYHVRVFF